MITRRHFVRNSATVVAAGSVRAVAAEDALFSVGLLADAQYADVEPRDIRHYRESIGKLRVAAKAINETGVEFTIHLGDLIDRDFESFDVILEPFGDLEKPVYQIPGNHDFDVEEDKKPDVFEKLGMSEAYRSFSKEGFRFIFLDGTELSTFANLPESENYQRASEFLKAFEAEGRKNAKSWNGGIGSGQLKWLESQLEAAKAVGERAIISCHYPVLPDNSHNLLNDREVLSLVDEFSETVAVWFNGHNHAGNYAQRNGVHFVTIEGMVNTADTNAFAVMDVSANALTIRGSGRVTDRVLAINS